MRAWSLAVLALVPLAGCVGDEPPAPPPPRSSSIEGWILDERFAPVVDAVVAIAATGLETTTDQEGRYGFDALPADELITLVVAAAGFEPASRTVHQHVVGRDYMTNFSLVQVPDTTPVREVTEFRGFIRCGLLVIVGHQHGQSPHDDNTYDCGGNLTDENVWLMPVKPGLTGAVFEVYWEADSPLAEQLAVYVEGVGVDGGEDVFFSFYEGRTGMKGTVSYLQALQYYDEGGGTVRFTIRPGAPESDVAFGAHINQEYEVIATLFYGEVPPATYTFAEGGS